MRRVKRWLTVVVVTAVGVLTFVACAAPKPGAPSISGNTVPSTTTTTAPSSGS